MANYERFSSTVKEFQLLGSQTMGKWVDLGTYTAKHGGGKQEFELYEHSWARYLKVRVLSYYGDEHYLTISQISVFGDTMLQGFHEHWEEEEKEQTTLLSSNSERVGKVASSSSEDRLPLNPCSSPKHYPNERTVMGGDNGDSANFVEGVAARGSSRISSATSNQILREHCRAKRGSSSAECSHVGVSFLRFFLSKRE